MGEFIEKIGKRKYLRIMGTKSAWQQRHLEAKTLKIVKFVLNMHVRRSEWRRS